METLDKFVDLMIEEENAESLGHRAFKLENVGVLKLLALKLVEKNHVSNIGLGDFVKKDRYGTFYRDKTQLETVLATLFVFENIDSWIEYFRQHSTLKIVKFPDENYSTNCLVFCSETDKNSITTRFARCFSSNCSMYVAHNIWFDSRSSCSFPRSKTLRLVQQEKNAVKLLWSAKIPENCFLIPSTQADVMYEDFGSVVCVATRSYNLLQTLLPNFLTLRTERLTIFFSDFRGFLKVARNIVDYGMIVWGLDSDANDSLVLNEMHAF
jgi:hypothetical protein